MDFPNSASRHSSVGVGTDSPTERSKKQPSASLQPPAARLLLSLRSFTNSHSPALGPSLLRDPRCPSSFRSAWRPPCSSAVGARCGSTPTSPMKSRWPTRVRTSRRFVLRLDAKQCALVRYLRGRGSSGETHARHVIRHLRSLISFSLLLLIHCGAAAAIAAFSWGPTLALAAH